MEQGKKVFGIYSRKSKFTGRGESIDNQVQLCKEYIKEKYGDLKEIYFEIYEDEGFSGKNTSRPEFQRLLGDLKERKLDCVVCYRLDRISRSVGDFANMVEEFERYKVDFICIKEQFDTSTPMGKAMMNIAAVFAQLERETIAERIRDNMLLLAKTGRWLGGATPLGFESKQVEQYLDDGRIQIYCKLSPVQEEISLVKLIYSKFLDCGSVTAVETYLIQQKIQTRNKKDFSPLSIRELLSNPVYCIADKEAYDYFAQNGCEMGGEREQYNGRQGVLAYNRTSNERNYQAKRPIHEWVIAIGKHKGIIKSAHWIKTQSILEKHKIYRFVYNPQNKSSLLSGLLFCTNCGAPMRPRVNSNSKPDEFGFKRFYYMCEMKRKSNRQQCASQNLPGNLLDRRISEPLLYHRYHPSSKFFRMLAELKEDILSGENTWQKQLRVVEERIAGKEKEIRGLIRLLSKTVEDSLLYKQTSIQVEELATEIQTLSSRIVELQKEENAVIDLDGQMQDLVDALNTMEETYRISSSADKRELLHKMIQRIEWDGSKVNVFLREEW